ncbi:response regulator transcription factor [Peribacillus alkalitolerans]|uniref:response regulator transcription factor n=1 Tax=Peribacillus alkalitolerans TaxID=1550385 RepID=UPI0013D4B7B2|nr:response regulator [Peribacillus alkalitolerans]
MNILLVDDEPLELEQLEYLIHLKHPNWNIFKAFDASKAIRIVANNEIHLVFLDIHLPGKNGLELGMELRRLYPNMEFVILTAYQNFEYARTSIKLKVVDYITKPLIEEDLRNVLKKYEHIEHYSDSIKQALSIIQKEYKEKISLTYLASKIHTNPSYLSRKFQDEVGIGFSDYVNQYRIQVAQEMLKVHPDWNIFSIAEECGFNSQHYFSQLFRKLTGKSPRDFRQEGINSEKA